MAEYSILGPVDGDESVCSISEIQKNLISLFDATTANQKSDHLEVFLRVRPQTKEEAGLDGEQRYLEMESDKAVLVHPLRDPVIPPPPVGASMGGGGRPRQGAGGAHKPAQTTTFQNYAAASQPNQPSLRFTFSKVFDEFTTQKTFFDDAVQSTVREFLDGQNCLVFAYGVTNSGKTHTMQGSPSDIGVVPRTFDVIFNSIGKRLYGRSDLKPSRFCDVETLDFEAESREVAVKESILRQIYIQPKKQLSINFSMSNSDISKSTLPEDSVVKDVSGSNAEVEEISTIVANRKREQACVAVEGSSRIRFSVWASFAEVYNEQAYDLLVPPPQEEARSRRMRVTNNVSGSSKLSAHGHYNNHHPYQNGRGGSGNQNRASKARGSSPPQHQGRRERVSLPLKEDVQGRPYISGLREVNVASADEAFKLLSLGRRNLQIAYTKLNEASSRSHCIFTLKLMRVMEANDGEDGVRHTKFNILSLCDLAGIERSCKTQNIGERVKEAGNINNSLFTLGRCIQAIRHNQVVQASDRQLLPPFRESKLTRLFQSFLTGKGRAKMIVTVSQCRSMYPENLNAIKFSAIAKQVTLVPAPVLSLDPLKPIVEEKKKSNKRNTIEWASASERRKYASRPVIGPLDSDDEDTSDSYGERSDTTVNEADASDSVCDGSKTEKDENDSEEDDDDEEVDYSKLALYVKKIEEENKKLKTDKTDLEAKIKAVMKDTEIHINSLHTKYEALLESAELRNEEAMDKRVELITGAYERQLKRHKLDEENQVSLMNHLRRLEEDLQTARQDVVTWKQNYDMSLRDIQSLTQEVTEVKFQAAAERMQVAERGSAIESQNLELKAENERLKKEMEEKDRNHENEIKSYKEWLDVQKEAGNVADSSLRNEVSDLKMVILSLETMSQKLMSDLEGSTLLAASHSSELAKVRAQNLKLLVRIKQLEMSGGGADSAGLSGTFGDRGDSRIECGQTAVGNDDEDDEDKYDLSYMLNNMSVAGNAQTRHNDVVKNCGVGGADGIEEEEHRSDEKQCGYDDDTEKDVSVETEESDKYDVGQQASVNIAADEQDGRAAGEVSGLECNDAVGDDGDDDDDAVVDEVLLEDERCIKESAEVECEEEADDDDDGKNNDEEKELSGGNSNGSGDGDDECSSDVDLFSDSLNVTKDKRMSSAYQQSNAASGGDDYDDGELGTGDNKSDDEVPDKYRDDAFKSQDGDSSSSSSGGGCDNKTASSGNDVNDETVDYAAVENVNHYDGGDGDDCKKDSVEEIYAGSTETVVNRAVDDDDDDDFVDRKDSLERKRLKNIEDDDDEEEKKMIVGSFKVGDDDDFVDKKDSLERKRLKNIEDDDDEEEEEEENEMIVGSFKVDLKKNVVVDESSKNVEEEEADQELNKEQRLNKWSSVPYIDQSPPSKKCDESEEERDTRITDALSFKTPLSSLPPSWESNHQKPAEGRSPVVMSSAVISSAAAAAEMKTPEVPHREEERFLVPDDSITATLYRPTRKNKPSEQSGRQGSVTAARPSGGRDSEAAAMMLRRVKSASRTRTSSRTVKRETDDDEEEYEPRRSTRKQPAKGKKTRQVAASSAKINNETSGGDDDSMLDFKENQYQSARKTTSSTLKFPPLTSLMSTVPTNAAQGRKKRNLMKMENENLMLDSTFEEKNSNQKTVTAAPSPLTSVRRHLRSRKQ